MPRIHAAAALTGAATKDGVHGEHVQPAVITVNGKQGNTYYGTVDGSWYTHLNYRNIEEESPETFEILNKQEIEIIFPERPLIGKVEAPESIEGAFIEIQTDRRILTFRLGESETALYRYRAFGTTATVEMGLPYEPEETCLALSREEDFENVSTADGDLPLIVFTGESGGSYTGDLHGYLYGFKKYQKNQFDFRREFKFREKLKTIKITLAE